MTRVSVWYNYVNTFMIDTQTTWQSALMEIEKEISKANFNTWFKQTYITKENGGVVYVGVPNAFAKEWLSTKYHKVILKSLREVYPGLRNVEYTVSKNVPKQKQTQSPLLKNQPSNELPLQNLYVDRETNLNPRYTFDNFVIGPFNELAYSATQAIIHKPGSYNPLFIYGPTGLGKTHLLQSVGNTLKKKYPEIKIFYISSDKFTDDYVNSLKNGRINVFKEKYRKYDVLIMDDVQFLSGREKSQEELFHLFNNLYDHGKQIIFSSDKHPNHIPILEDRLKTRFGAGMIVDISEPDYESKMAILTTKSKEYSVFADTDALQHLAQSIQGSIRELEGIINTTGMQAEIKGRNLNILEVKNIIKNNISPRKNTSIQEIVEVVSQFYDIDPQTVYERTRRKEIVRCRQVAMYLLREDFNISYPMIGRKMGGKDHTTVIHSCNKIKEDLQKDHDLIGEIEQLRQILKI